MMPAAIVIVTLLLAALVAGRRWLALVTVRGTSMEPTFRDGELLLARRTRGRFRRGAVVVVNRPDDPRAARLEPYLIKRVVAVEGEPAPAADLPPGTVDAFVPAHRVVLRGDNPTANLDSHVLGYFDTRQVRFVVLGRRAPKLPGKRSRDEENGSQNEHQAESPAGQDHPADHGQCGRMSIQ